MKLYFIRHAPAEFRHVFAQTGQSDSLRPLTEKGTQRMKDVLKHFSKFETNIDVFLQSPLTRAQQTGDICRSFYPDAKFVTTENLSPDHSAQRLYDEIQSYDVDAMAIVGHEPDLGQFLSWLMFRQATDHFPLKKSGIAKIDLYKDGRCYLKWMLRPKLVTVVK